MQVLKLGKLPGQQSMLIFHALARMGFEGLVIVSPKIPLVSVGTSKMPKKRSTSNTVRKRVYL